MYWQSNIIFLCLSYAVFCSRYDYILFENVEVIKKSFVKEHAIISELFDIRKNLKSRIRRNYFHSNGNVNGREYATLTDYFFYLKTNRGNWPNLQQNIVFYEKPLANQQVFDINTVSRYNDCLHRLTYNYSIPEKLIIQGALKGLIMLHETYKVNITEFAKGHIGNEKTTFSRHIDSLQPDDLAYMSTIAMTVFKWYDNSLNYLKAAFDHVYYSSKTIQNNFLQTSKLQETLLSMKNIYSIAHNEMLYKNDVSIGSEYKLYEYIVDTGVLKTFKPLNRLLTTRISKYFNLIYNHSP